MSLILAIAEELNELYNSQADRLLESGVEVNHFYGRKEERIISARIKELDAEFAKLEEDQNKSAI